MLQNASGGVKGFPSRSLIRGWARWGGPAENSYGLVSRVPIWWVVWRDWAREPDRIDARNFFSRSFSKIFILNGLSCMAWRGSLQNIEPQELTGKIFQNKDLAWERSLHFFSIRLRKILILNDLVNFDRMGSAQNIEPQGLTAKIFQNKDLAPGRRQFRESAVENWLGEPSRM